MEKTVTSPGHHIGDSIELFADFAGTVLYMEL